MSAKEKTCPHCSSKFVPAGKCDAFCALSGTCGMVRCPRCGHEFPDLERSFFARVLTKWLKRPCDSEEPAPGSVKAVSDLDTGFSGTIAEVRSGVMERASELLAFGVVPGATLLVIQRHPEIVVKVGETTLSIERSVASDIWVRA